MPKIKSNKILIIDGSYIIIRSLFGALNSVYESDIVNYTWKIILNKIFDLHLKWNFDRIYFVLEGEKKRIAKFQKCSTYKLGRKPLPSDFYAFFLSVPAILKIFGITVIKHIEHEADDVIASLASYFENKNSESYIFTRDKDLFQIVSDKTLILDFDGRLISESEIVKKFSIPIEKLVDFFSMVGDTGDNLPGVRGLGPQKALLLIRKYGTCYELIKTIVKKGGYLHKEELLFVKGIREFFFTRYMITLYKGIYFNSTLLKSSEAFKESYLLKITLEKNNLKELLYKLQELWHSHR